MSQRKTVTYPNPDVLAQAVAVRVLTTIRNLLAEPGRRRVDIALTGGTDGNRVLRAIGTDPLADDLDASRVHIWWGDERFVPEDSDDRNAGSGCYELSEFVSNHILCNIYRNMFSSVMNSNCMSYELWKDCRTA